MSTTTHSHSQPFVVGTNLPWVGYGIDFGANAWQPTGGINRQDPRERLDRAFEYLAASGLAQARWFLFCDGRAGIRFDDEGTPTGLDDFVFRDIDAAIELARKHRMTLMFVLLDFLWCGPPRVVRDVQLGGRGRVLDDSSRRAALIERAFLPVLERYGAEPQIFAWDVMNEPEWIKTVGKDALNSFFVDAIKAVRSSTEHRVTLGSAGARWRERYCHLDLDFYQVHWYDKLRRQPPLDTPVSALGFDRPVLLGEFPTRGSRKRSDDIVAIAREAGYAGAFSWSALAEDECSAPLCR